MATDFEKVNISLRATKSFRPDDDDLMTKMKALKVLLTYLALSYTIN